MKLKLLFGALALTATMSLGSAPSYAIDCNGPYQVVRGHGEISTPFCEDSYLAFIGRKYYGYRYSNRQVRQNPNLKKKLCDHYGHDSRVSEICATERDDGFNRYR